MKIRKLHGNVTKIESGHWVVTSTDDCGFALNLRTGEFFNFERAEIDDITVALTECKSEMIREHHGYHKG
jgi:hypothetical protein